MRAERATIASQSTRRLARLTRVPFAIRLRASSSLRKKRLLGMTLQ